MTECGFVFQEMTPVGLQDFICLDDEGHDGDHDHHGGHQPKGCPMEACPGHGNTANLQWDDKEPPGPEGVTFTIVPGEIGIPHRFRASVPFKAGGAMVVETGDGGGVMRIELPHDDEGSLVINPKQTWPLIQALYFALMVNANGLCKTCGILPSVSETKMCSGCADPITTDEVHATESIEIGTTYIFEDPYGDTWDVRLQKRGRANWAWLVLSKRGSHDIIEHHLVATRRPEAP